MKTENSPQIKVPSLKAIAEELYCLGVEPDAIDHGRRRYAALEAETAERIGELTLALASQKEKVAHLERTKTLCLSLIKAMEAVHASEDFKGLWALAQVHGVEYKGPSYKKEFVELKKEVFA